MKTGTLALWIVVAVLTLIAMNGFLESSSDPNTGNLVRALGKLQGTVFGVAAAGLAIVLLLRGRAPDADELHDGDQHSGCDDFREQPALLAVANAIERNDEDAIRAAVKNVPDLQAAGREGKTLLYFAVEEALKRPQLVKAVATLLSCGADPNYNNGKPYSFAMWRGSTGDVSLLRTLLDAGGNPNGTDYLGKPIICELLDAPYSEGDRRDRLRLLLDRGADINSTRPNRDHTLLMDLALLGNLEPVAFADALDLLERGADYHRAGNNLTLVKMLAEQRRAWSAGGKAAPPEFEKLCDWLRQHGANLEDA